MFKGPTFIASLYRARQKILKDISCLVPFLRDFNTFKPKRNNQIARLLIRNTLTLSAYLCITASCAITSTESTLSDNNLNSCYNLPATSPRELEVSFILEPREHCHRKSKIQVLLHTGSSLVNETCGSLGRMFFSQVDGCNGKMFQACEVVDPETPGTDGKCTIECSCGAEDCRVTFFRGPMIPTLPDLTFCEAYILYG